MKKNILVTGGAGFIGSNLVEALLKDKRIGTVRVLDNLSAGHEKNIQEFYSNSNFEFMWGDIRDYQTCEKACKGMDIISHQAAMGSVPRSIEDPITTNGNNITGTLNIFTAAKEQGIKRVVYAASSSTYGDSVKLPKIENEIGAPLSPYAVTKLVSELYAKVFADLYKMEFIGLRYFNIYGPKQDPNGAYAAVIPLFFKAALTGKPCYINGDGSFSRDYTYVGNAIKANLLGIFTNESKSVNQVYNVACGERTTLLELWNSICNVVGVEIDPIFREFRAGDIPHSLANINKIMELLNYNAEVKIDKGLGMSFDFYKRNL